jgi:hypothetical protein
MTVLSAGPVELVGADTTAPADVLMMLLSPFTITVFPFEETVVPAGTEIDSPLASVIDCPGASAAEVTWMTNVFVTVATGLAESETITLKVFVPAVVGVPEITPELRVKPAGSVPLVTAQV